MADDAVSGRRLAFEAPDLDLVAAWIERQPAYARLVFRAAEPKVFQETCLETEDWSLYRAGFSLSIRDEQPEGEVILRGLRDGTSEAVASWMQPLTEYSSGGAAGGVAARVRLITAEAPLQTLFTTRTQRRIFEVSDTNAVIALIHLDAVAVAKDGNPLGALSQVEIVEMRKGGLKSLHPFIEGLGEACNLTPCEPSPFEHELRLAGLAPASYLDFGYAGLDPDATTGEYAYARLRRYFADVLANEPGTRLGEDLEALHDMRVAIRRLRAAIGVFEPVISPRFLVLREELKWFGQMLGALRDLDVQLLWLTGEREAENWAQSVAIGPLIEEVALAGRAQRATLLDAMRSARYADLLGGLRLALVQSDYTTDASAEPVRVFASRVLRRRFSRFAKPAEQLGEDSTSADYHAVRIRGKRLRYAIESFYPLFGVNGRVSRMVDAAKRAQDLLGEYQDCVTAIAQLQRLAFGATRPLPPDTVFLMGELTERRRTRMAEIREAWPAASEALVKSWRPVAKELKKALATPSAPGGESEGTSRTPSRAIQRPFWLLRPFLGRDKRGM